jgi:ribosomal protein S27E
MTSKRSTRRGRKAKAKIVKMRCPKCALVYPVESSAKYATCGQCGEVLENV